MWYNLTIVAPYLENANPFPVFIYENVTENDTGKSWKRNDVVRTDDPKNFKLNAGL